jgi:hypothetical protein
MPPHRSGVSAVIASRQDCGMLAGRPFLGCDGSDGHPDAECACARPHRLSVTSSVTGNGPKLEIRCLGQRTFTRPVSNS